MSADESKLRIDDYLEHMLEATRLARTFTEGMNKTDFLADKRTQQAVILNLVTIGEAASKLSNDHKEFVAAHPNIPWPQMKGMRNRMAHGYFAINLDIVWDTIQTALPSLEDQLAKIQAERTSAD